MLEGAPVGNDDAMSRGGAPSGFKVYRPSSSKTAQVGISNRKNSAFSGAGMTLGTSSSKSRFNGIRGVLGTGVVSIGSDDLTDRREKIRKAALSRLS